MTARSDTGLLPVLIQTQAGAVEGQEGHLRKPGYDPAELFVDPALSAPALTVAWALAKKTLGFRYLMQDIPLDASLVKGSHGRPTDRLEDGPVVISSERALQRTDVVEPTDVKALTLRHLFE